MAGEKIDIREQAQQVSFTNGQNATEVGYFMRLAEFSPEAKGIVGVVAIILDKTGKIHYREPRSIRFIFDS
jgi:hypothetical protein